MSVSKYINISLSDVQGVLIDLDDTLYVYEDNHDRALKDVHKEFFSDMDYSEFARFYRNARNAVTQRLVPQGACRSRLFAFQNIFETLGVQQPFVRAYVADALYWDSFIANMVLAPAADAFLVRCETLGLPVCIVSDMTAHVQIRKIEKLGLAKRIAHLITSEEVGAEKPDARMFLAGMQKLGIRRGEDVIMIGDSLEKDIIGAQTINIRAYQVSLTQEF
ncbi:MULTISPECIES: HAD family hydrolase [Acetobacter]|uniref:Putative hydrolase of the HAD superfamily n=1 Tax=Acetobacter lovaniensis TaxID=104100 RepID=A0A841QE32_9PROT|nr:HAD family hydrolase [Acetobacter lovaniensis]MBB6456658.1 putative hydrolase of the HAD superfamily [Acetobacter lovaniensis]NHN81521.1 HAD-IA family hydrolase [Acetobacter lovaniensis]GBQ65410.1 putative hydrolase [Acetobacter lovaniensis NRIC 0474]